MRASKFFIILHEHLQKPLVYEVVVLFSFTNYFVLFDVSVECELLSVLPVTQLKIKIMINS